MQQDKIKFINTFNQDADEIMIMSFLNNASLGSILKTNKGQYFYITEEREQTTMTEYSSVFIAFTVQRVPGNTLTITPIARASTEEIFINCEPDTYYLATLLVDEDVRDMGIGSAIIQFLQSVAAERNFKSFELNSTVRMRISRFSEKCKVDANEYFYLKNGFTPIAYRNEERSMTRFGRSVKESDKLKNKSSENEEEIINGL